MIPVSLKGAFRDTLISGGYNLLLGAGISLDSKNPSGDYLRSGEKLRKDLCQLVGVNENTPIQRAYTALSQNQIKLELVQKFTCQEPGNSAMLLPEFVWRRIFTFNIDDVIEQAYSRKQGRKQDTIPVNFNAPFEATPTKDHVQVIHLHGWVRDAGVGFVFSYAEYARIMSGLNPWMHTLAEILASESFIISGTSLNEGDLEYYLSYRNKNTPRKGRGPSILVEPYPDAITEKDCKRHDLLLVKETYTDFISWVKKEFPTVPTVAELIVPDTRTLFSAHVKPHSQLRFFSDFQVVSATQKPTPKTPGPFLYGRPPDWEDINQHLDIERASNQMVLDLVRKLLSDGYGGEPRIVLAVDEAGTGKSTLLKRIGHELTGSGIPVFYLKALEKIDRVISIEMFKELQGEAIVLVDGLADHAEQILDVASDSVVASKVVFLCSERIYRKDYLDIIFSGVIIHEAPQKRLTQDECKQLIGRYREFGLIGDPGALRKPDAFALSIMNEPISVAICRILNDFHPIDSIVDSLWEASSDVNRMIFLSVALCQHCYKEGVKFGLLQSSVGKAHSVSNFINQKIPLPISYNENDPDYIISYNSAISERTLKRAALKESQLLKTVFSEIARVLAPHVNRGAILRRTAEARLAGRLFDADKVVIPLLSGAAESFFVSIKSNWEWDSRYWEQRALLASKTDLSSGIQYARHAVAINLHPFPLTTLGKLLFLEMESTPFNLEASYTEGLKILIQAVDLENRRSRITIYPFITILSGTAKFIELGGGLNPGQDAQIKSVIVRAQSEFPGHPIISDFVRKLEYLGVS